MPGNVHPVGNEREALLAYLAQQRYVLRLAAYGLSEAEIRATPSQSSLSIGGIIKHVTAVERYWMDVVLQRVKGFDAGSAEDYADNFRLGRHDSFAAVLDDYREAAQETEDVVGSIADPGQAVPVPPGVPWFPEDVKAWSVRWVLLHLIEESARHAGHADLLREAIDGATAYPLMGAAENWPSTPWIQPWKATA